MTYVSYKQCPLRRVQCPFLNKPESGGKRSQKQDVACQIFPICGMVCVKE